MRSILSILAAAMTTIFLSLTSLAAEAPKLPYSAVIRTSSGVGAKLQDVTAALGDANRKTGFKFTEKCHLTLSFDKTQELAGMYLIWDMPPANWSYSPTADSDYPLIRDSGFLHEYVPIETFTTGEVHLNIPKGADLRDVYLLGEGETPEFVQQWKPPVKAADLLLIPTHADDEHIFFGGIMPTYAPDPNFSVQVAYMVNHNGEPYRPHELLNGLWTVGIRNYPIIPEFHDIYSTSLEHAKTVYSEDAIVEYQRNLILRFEPQVIIGHDLKGEYGHGAHMLNAESLKKSVELAANDGWDTPKLYLHLYKENPVILDFDTPLPAFGGKTALMVAVEGFAKHVSQQQFFEVLASGPYDCRKFGLYRTRVGLDTGNDLFENITPYALQKEEAPPPVVVERVSSEAPLPTDSSGGTTSREEKPLYLPEATGTTQYAFIGSPLVAALLALGVGLLLAGGIIAPFIRMSGRKHK